MIRPALFLCLPLLLAACARSEDASYVAPDSKQGYNQVGQVRTPEADDREPAIGQWRASLQDNRAALEFGPIGAEPMFSLQCADNAAIFLQRHGEVPAGALPAMQVQIGDVGSQLPVTSGAGALPMLRGTLASGTPLYAALLAGAQPILVRLGNAAPLVLPPGPLVGDYVRGCGRAGAGLPLGGNSAAGNSAGGNSAAPIGNAAAPAPADNVQAPPAPVRR